MMEEPTSESYQSPQQPYVVANNLIAQGYGVRSGLLWLARFL